ncbi:APC family permease [Nocardia sp. NPDC127579]|uniref:APC family permease n=1 Tax=Nocardia sp. NPDC127579 TaxID=3345402 RepID=UPI00362EF596
MVDMVESRGKEVTVADPRVRRMQRGDKYRLTAVGGLAALSLDALSSVAYGPEAIVLVLVVAGAGAVSWALPVAGVIALLLLVLVLSYRQVIAVHPDGGGSYAVAKRHLGRFPALLAAASLVVDYVLTVAVSLAAGAASLVSAFPALDGHLLTLTLIGLALLTVLNLIGVAESAKVLMAPAFLFIALMVAVIVTGLLRSAPVAVVGTDRAPFPILEAVGILLLLKAFAAGCSALTGVEAIANAVPSFRSPAVRRAQHTEVALGVLLGVLLLGLAWLIRRHEVVPRGGVTVLAQLAAAAFGTGWLYYLTNLVVTVVLVLAANTSFGGLPVLLSLLAKDRRLPSLFAMRSERPVYRYGVAALAVTAGSILVIVDADTHRLLPLYAIGVFIGFTISQTGLVRHWYRERGRGWVTRSALNGFGATLTCVAGVVLLAEKFHEGAWLLLIIVPALIMLFARTENYYRAVARTLRLGSVPPPLRLTPDSDPLVLVPVVAMSEVTVRALETALRMHGEIRAVAAEIERSKTEHLSALWQEWHPGIPLVVLPCPHRNLVATLTAYVRKETATGRPVTVLLAQVEPTHWRHRVFHNPRGPVLATALRVRTDAVVATMAIRVD